MRHVLGTDGCHKYLCAAVSAGDAQGASKEALTFGWKKLTIAAGIPRHCEERNDVPLP